VTLVLIVAKMGGYAITYVGIGLPTCERYDHVIHVQGGSVKVPAPPIFTSLQKNTHKLIYHPRTPNLSTPRESTDEGEINR
jgi:hypothetical protein